MEYRILGPLEVIADGGVLDLGPGRARVLLAALVLHAGRDVSTETLGDALWRGAEPASWRKSLQMQVVRLRSRIGRSVIETSPRGYRLVADEHAIDAERFVAGLRSPASERHRRMDDLIAMWRGRPYDDLDSWPPAVAARAMLEALHADAIDAQLGAEIRRGVASAAEIERLLDATPERENRWALLMYALYRAGRQAEALRAFDRARARLTDDFGIEPGIDLVALHRAILDQDPRLDAIDLDFSGSGVRSDPRVSIDLWFDAAVASTPPGKPDRAVEAAESAARLARLLGDWPRLARAALIMAGDGWLTGIDPQAQPLGLLAEALSRLSPAPSPLRAQLLSRLAVAESHNQPVEVAERDSAESLSLARLLDDPETTAIALQARLVVDQDIAHLTEREQTANELLTLALDHDEPRWRAWALPHLARVHALRGDLTNAIARLEDLERCSIEHHDPVGVYHAAGRHVLAATVAGNYPAAEAAAATVRDAGVRALMDPTAAALAYHGTVGILKVLQHSAPEIAFADDLAWPQETMHAAFQASIALRSAEAGNLDAAGHAIAALTPARLAALPRDLYWPTVVWLMSSTCRLIDDRERAQTLLALAAPFADVCVVDGGSTFLGSMQHHLGVLAAAAGDTHRARDYFEAAVATHRRVNAPGWLTRSEHELSAGLAAAPSRPA